ncbi:uncharacterized protein PFLUO_LOCUS5642 [Penicillium psychrofluorescens]|uniref:uncharacterized protein n=1 Tax=Penicillium psychrofluorescens TaxID=3158075 RepID=UPI003CCD7E57
MDHPSLQFESGSLSPLSPAVSATDFDVFADANDTLRSRLAEYEPTSDNDNVVQFLLTVFKFLPLQGQVNLARDVAVCHDDDMLRQLDNYIDSSLLRPLLAQGGRTPAITSSSLPGAEESVEDLLSLDLESATRQQTVLRRKCLERDEYRCVVTKACLPGHGTSPSDRHAPLEAVHIIPFALGSFPSDERRANAEVWSCIYRYFPNIQCLFHENQGDINRLDNVMMMVSFLHKEFGAFRFVLVETETPNRYRVKRFSRFSDFFDNLMPEYTVSPANHPLHPPPKKQFLAVHAAVGNILHTTGRGAQIEEILDQLGDDDSYGLATDGSTKIADLLSVTSLSLLSANPSPMSPSRSDKLSHYATAKAYHVTENEPPEYRC